MKKNKNLLMAVQIVTAALFGALYGFGLPFGAVELNIGGYPAGYMLNMIFVTFLMIFVFKKAFKVWDFGFRKKGLKKGIFWYGLPSLIGTAIIVLVQIKMLQPLNVRPVFMKILMECIIFYLLVGVVEETLVRGGILNALRRGLGKSLKGMAGSILISSALFSLMHLVGAPGDTALLIKKLIWTFCGGIVWAVIYMLTDNLLSVIILHGLLDISVLPVWFSSSGNVYAAQNVVLVISITCAVVAVIQFVKHYPKDKEFNMGVSVCLGIQA